MSELSKTDFNERRNPNKDWRSLDTCRTGPVPGLFRLTEGCSALTITLLQLTFLRGWHTAIFALHANQKW